MIEYSDYIAISVPELRFAGKKNYVCDLAKYIKNKKPAIDIHLLGCTELELLHKCKFATSSDSTTWIAGKRFGFIEGRHISSIKEKEVRQQAGDAVYDSVNEYNNVQNTNFLCLSVELFKRKYEKAAGNQDYYK